MASGPDYDIAILGGGLAGLSVVVRLVASSSLRVLVIEPRTEYRRDRTWSYWRLHDHPFGDAVAHRWSNWEVMRSDRDGHLVETVRSSERIPYESIPADRLYEDALACLSRAPHIELRLGTEARALTEQADRVAIDLGGEIVIAGHVLDSRPPRAGPGALAQRFLGQEVETDRPVFDPTRLTLMDFAVTTVPGAVRFLYVLPASPTRALVEDTWLASPDLPLPDHRAAIRTYLTERFGVGDYAVGFEEEGAIPMDAMLQGDTTPGRIVAIGAPGGAVKPSSGYAFLAIQRQADAIAADLAAGRPPRPVSVRGPGAQWMDAIFLSALRDRPETAPLLFERLFARCEPAPLIRFLNDLGSPADVARVIAAMPKLPMLEAAFRNPRGRQG